MTRKQSMPYISGTRFVLWIPLIFLYPVVLQSRSWGHTSYSQRERLKPFQPGPFDVIDINADDEAGLSIGQPVLKQTPSDDTSKSGGRAICVQDVDAPKDAVWNQILDLNQYVGKVPKLKECKNYWVGRKPDGTIQVKTKMVIGVLPGYKYKYHCDHIYVPHCDSVTWSLDRDKTSDFDDVVGHWHVEDHPKKPGCSRVFYACDIRFKNPVPGPVKKFLAKSALQHATSWVKRESERSPESSIPVEIKDLQENVTTHNF